MIILRDKTYLEQKEFGVVEKLGKVINKHRSNIANKLEKDITKDLELMKDARRVRVKQPILRSKKIEAGLKAEAESSGTLVTNARLDNKSSASLSKGMKRDELNNKIYETLNEDNPAALEELKSKMDSKKKSDVISYPSNASIQDLAHEVGHLKTKNLKGIKNKVANFISHKTKANDKIGETVDAEASGKGKSGLGKAAANYLRGKAIVREEINANNEGRRLLKKHGLPDKFSKNVNDSYNAGEESYKAASRIAWKSPLKNSIKPKNGRKN